MTAPDFRAARCNSRIRSHRVCRSSNTTDTTGPTRTEFRLAVGARPAGVSVIAVMAHLGWGGERGVNPPWMGNVRPARYMRIIDMECEGRMTVTIFPPRFAQSGRHNANRRTNRRGGRG